jgi:Ca2+-transporting ATPase
MRSTTASYAALSLAQLANLMQVRSETLSVFTLGFFKNKFAIGAAVIAVLMLLAFMYVPFLSTNLRMLPITGKDWLAAIATMLAVFVFEEALKVDNNKT